jgi:hypothetical protein
MSTNLPAPISIMPEKTSAMQDRIAVSSIEDLFRPLPGDAHPASGVCRVIAHLVIHEINRVAEGAGLPLVDDVDEDRYIPAIAPLLARAKRDWRQDNPRPCADELKSVRASIREFDRWKRKPTAQELSEAVYKALGIERPVSVAGGDAEARRVINAPKSLPASPDAEKTAPSWLSDFAEVVGDNELLSQATIRPLLNMSEGAARRAILMMKAGKESKRDGDSEVLQQQRQSTNRRNARKDYVDSLLAQVKSMNRKSEDFGDGSVLDKDWGMPGFICMGRFDEDDSESLWYAPGRVFKPTGIPGKVSGWVPTEEYRSYLVSLGDSGADLLNRFDIEHRLVQDEALRPMSKEQEVGE